MVAAGTTAKAAAGVARRATATATGVVATGETTEPLARLMGGPSEVQPTNSISSSRRWIWAGDQGLRDRR